MHQTGIMDKYSIQQAKFNQQKNMKALGYTVVAVALMLLIFFMVGV
jgi:hypothetical protein